MYLLVRLDVFICIPGLGPTVETPFRVEQFPPGQCMNKNKSNNEGDDDVDNNVSTNG